MISKYKSKEKSKGITLIALVITIIILLILVSITINNLTGKKILDMAKQAKEISENEKNSENNKITEYKNEIDKYITINENKKQNRYILFEIYSHFDGNGASISEITIYDKYDNKINYNIIENEVFDSVDNGKPYYWNHTYWNYTNLYDNNINYSYNLEGGNNCTLFLHNNNSNSEEYARFIIDIGKETEISHINICIGDPENRTPKSISVYSIDNYSNETYNKNVAQRNNEGLTLIKKVEFTSIITSPEWYDFIGEKNSNTILFDIYSHIGGNCAAISEIKLYTKKGNELLTTINKEEVFDESDNGKPYYWENSRWNYTYLNDNNENYGEYSSAIFLIDTNADVNKYARFIINTENIDIGNIQICVGDSNGRTPKQISAYQINNYSADTYNKNIAQRNNEGLTLIKTIEFSSVVTSPTWFNFIK